MHIKSLSLRGRLIASAAALALTGAGALAMASGASASNRPDATPNCAQCITFSSDVFGPGFVFNANKKSNVRLRNLSDTYTNEDFIIDNGIHTVQWFVSHGLISASSFAAVNYPFFYAFQVEVAPNGNPSAQCVGLAAPAANGEGVTKQPCGVNAQTLWIFDRNSGLGGNCLTTAVYCPLINGSDSNFSNPEALTAGSDSGQLHVTTENDLGPGSAAGDTQQFEHTP